jgi:hypothetical protein
MRLSDSGEPGRSPFQSHKGKRGRYLIAHRYRRTKTDNERTRTRIAFMFNERIAEYPTGYREAAAKAVEGILDIIDQQIDGTSK